MARLAPPALALMFAAGLLLAADRFLPPGFGPWTVRVLAAIPADGHPASVSALAFSADGARLASAGWDGSLRLWRWEDGFLLARAALPGSVVALRLGEDLVWAMTSEGKLWQWAPGDVVAPVGSCDTPAWPPLADLCAAEQGPTPGGSAGAHGIAAAGAISETGVSALGGWDGGVRIRSDSGGQRDALGAPALTVAAPQQGDYLASSHGFGLSGEGEIRLFDRRARLLRRLHHPSAVAGCVAFAAAGRVLLARDRRGRFASWQLPDGERREGLPEGVVEACPQPDRSRLAVAIWEQVRGGETMLLDRQTGWAATLTERYLRVVRRNRSWRDRLLGRLPLFALDVDGYLVLSRAEPRWPTPLIVLGAILAPLAAGSLGRSLRRRRR